MGDGGMQGSAHRDLRVSSVLVRLGGELLSLIGDGVGEGDCAERGGEAAVEAPELR